MASGSHSHHLQLGLAALGGALAATVTISAATSIQRQRRRKQLEDDVQSSLSGQGNSGDLPSSRQISDELADLIEKRVEPVVERLSRGEDSEELFREQLARCYALFKDEGMERIRQAKVVVVGCGGVGSWAAVMLVRSGISHIRLIDFDRVTMSSLNRHATATLSDVGTSKVHAMKKALLKMSLKVEVDAREELWSMNDAATLLEGADWVIDAIDNITTKVDLLKYCHEHGIKVISSMGAGSKLDPTRIQITDISLTTEDSLSRAVRIQLRKAGISSGIPVIYSTEQPVEDIKLLPLPEEERQKGNVQELTPFDDFRVRILPVFGPLPSIFGLNAAAYVLCEVAGRPIASPLASKGRRKLYEKLLRDLKVREEKRTGEVIDRLPIDETDVAFVLEDLHRGRSIVPPHAVPNKITLAIWDPSMPLSVANCVVFDWHDYREHMSGFDHGLKPEQIWDEEVVELVKKRRKEAEEWWIRSLQ